MKPRSPQPRARGPTNALPLLVLVLVSFAVYANALRNGFVLDDESQVLRNPWLQSWRSIPDMFSKNVWSFMHGAARSNYYRPLMHVIYLITYQLAGFRAWAFHLVNIVLHSAVTGCVYLLTARLVGLDGKAAPPAAVRIPALLGSVPFVAALLFATHPVHTEAVTWIASVPELSFTLFFLAGLYFYAAPARRTRATVACFAVALLCKETALTLPAVCVAYDVALGRKERWIPDRVVRYAPFVAVAGLYMAVRYQVLSGALVPLSRSGAAPGSWILAVLQLFGAYVRSLLLPNQLHFWHALHPTDSLTSARGIAALAVALAFLAALAVAWRRHRLAFFALALFFLPLLPAFYINALPGKPFAERYLYLPSVGFVLGVALGLNRMLAIPRLRAVGVVALASTTLLYAVGTVTRNVAWKDFYALFLDNLAKSPDAPVPCDDLSNELFRRGKTTEALALFEAQVRRDATNGACQSGLGSALLLAGRVDEAIEHLRLAVTLDPSRPAAYNDLGIALKRKGDLQGAIEQYRTALALDPEYADLHFSLAGALADTGQLAEALDEYRAAVHLSPLNAYYRNVLGIECAKQGRVDEAIGEFEHAIRLDPSEPAYRNNLERARGMKP